MFLSLFSSHLHINNSDKLSTKVDNALLLCLVVSINFKLYVIIFLFLLFDFFISFLIGIEKDIYLFVFNGIHFISLLHSFANSLISYESTQVYLSA